MVKTWLCKKHEHLEPLPLNKIQQHLADCDTCSNNVAKWDEVKKDTEYYAAKIRQLEENIKYSKWGIQEHEADIESYIKELKEAHKEQQLFMETTGVIEPGWADNCTIQNGAKKFRMIYEYGDLHTDYYCVVYGDGKELYRTKTYKIDLSAWHNAHDMAYKI